MPVYEFTCAKGHVTEDLVPVGTKAWPCAACHAERVARAHASNDWFGKAGLFKAPPVIATRILSPTPTTFEFADNRKR